MAQGVADRLEKANIAFDRAASRSFSTPRRLALLLAAVAGAQPDQTLERRGPAVAAAFDAEGQPTPAAEGFARSVGTDVGSLQRIKTDKGEWLYCEQHVAGQPLEALLFDILHDALRQLPIPRPMRWADHDFSFARPVHWVAVLHGTNVLRGKLLGKDTGRETFGHRIHSPGPHSLDCAGDYEETLLDARVIADPASRRARIVEALEAADSKVALDDSLLDEVNNLVEWPVAVPCTFDEAFLEVPHAALVASMQDHQKFFPVRADGGADSGTSISNRFVAISNIESTDLSQVRSGYERVIRPRLADARFFLEQDQKKPLADYLPTLDEVVFQEKIGTIGDKCRRVVELSEHLAGLLGVDAASCTRAAALSKCDLMTQMVGEFPELQGLMGEHYARVSGETEAVAQAIGEHYAPRFAGDAIPGSASGQVVGLADRVDTLVACFAAGLAPSGNKDPFALRRAALGLVRILSEAQRPVPLKALFAWAGERLPGNLECDAALCAEIHDFVLQRARGYYRERGYETALISAALASPWSHIPDLDARLAALSAFMGRPEASSLAAANKRIGNILRKADATGTGAIKEDLLDLAEERRLFEAVSSISQQVGPLMANSDYASSLEAMAALREPVDAFFDTVLVMDDDPDLQRNRLALLGRLKSQFDQVADLSILG
ncbi:MAG: glycine--tRNA ligase subunit beta [Xanthomonadales bacterium]|nr:glycine--tRNA ligase subunit beta [Xanthomonadales bacterium]